MVLFVADSSGSPVGAKWVLGADDCDQDRLSHVIHQRSHASAAWVRVFVCAHVAWEAGRKVCVCVYTNLIFSIRLMPPVRRGEAQRSAHCFLMKLK